MRRAAKIDNGQRDAVKFLRSIPGIEIAPGHDDFLLGYKGKTFWFEFKSTGAISKKTGLILESQIKPSQKKLRETWTGHYSIVSSVKEILAEIGIKVQ